MDLVLWVFAALVIAPAWYVFSVGLFVAGGMWLCADRARHEAMDARQVEVFGRARGRLGGRWIGLFEESLCQSAAFFTQALYALGVLRLPRGAAGAPPVVVLPGYTENGGTLWWLTRRLVRAGFDPIAVDFPSTYAPIERNAAFLGERLRAIRAERGCGAVPVVAHSMGGLITRAWMLSDAEHGVSTLVAVGSPFRGTLMARIGYWTSRAKSCLDMIPGSNFLLRHGPERATGVPVLSLVAPQENIVCPAWSVVLPEATNVVLPHAWGHEAPLFKDAAFRVIESWLRDRAVAAGDVSTDVRVRAG